MHKLISIDNSNNTTNDGVEHFCMLPKHRNDLGSATLNLIVISLHASKIDSDQSRLHIKQVYQSWERILSNTVANSQIHKAMGMAVHTWIDLITDHQMPQIDRNKLAESFLRHLKNCLSVFNLGKNRHAIKVLHYILLHPVSNLPNHLMQQQADLQSVVSSAYHTHEDKPSYATITQNLLVACKRSSQSIWLIGTFMSGIVIGLLAMYMLQLTFVHTCTT